MKTYAILVAGGSGSRMNAPLPKQFLLLKNRPILCYTIQAFLEALPGVYLVLVLPADHLETGKQILDRHFPGLPIELTAGGETRFHSVQKGLQLVREESIVLVHDAVRCLVTPGLIRQCFQAALEKGSAIPVIDVKDSIRLLTPEGSEPMDRQRIKLVQTPQAFYSGILLPAFQIDYKEKFTDEATVAEAFGIRVHLVPGEETNIKITTPADLETADRLLENR